MVDAESRPARPTAGAAPGAPAAAEPKPDALVDEAIKKASVAWIAVQGQRPAALWCVPISGQLYLVSGPGEQAAPWLEGATNATVTLRGDHGGRIVTWPAEVTRVMPDTEEWETAAPQLAGKRLNASGTAEALVARWAKECVVYRLAPAGPALEAGATLPDTALAESVRETPAVRAVRRPFRLHRVRPRA